MRNWRTKITQLQWGDWLVLVLAISLNTGLWWQSSQYGQAQKCQIRQGSQLIGVYDLQQDRTIVVAGKLGKSVVQIHAGKVRFQQAPCHHQYCVQQGWLSRAGQVVLCLPNQVSIRLLGERGFDSLSY